MDNKNIEDYLPVILAGGFGIRTQDVLGVNLKL